MLLRAIVIATACLAATAHAADLHDSSAGPLKVEPVVTDLERPWAFVFLPEGGLLITERPGALRIWRDGRLSDPVGGLPEIRAQGQGGLLDVALANDFAESRRIYLSYAAPAGMISGQTQLAIARLSEDEQRLEDVRIVFRQEPSQSTSRHFGSRIVIAPDGNVFVSVGDRGEREEAQNPASHQGAVIRLTAEGAPHPDNPFADGERGWRPEIFSYGHRNPQGMTMDSDGVLWTVEHGARGGDEINRPEVGKNYGWPTISYGRHYSGAKIGVGSEAPGMEQPVFYWDPSIAPSGMAVYEGEMFPEWRGDILVGALRSQLLARVDMEGGEATDEERLFTDDYGRIRDVRVAADGSIWFATDSDDGVIYRVSRP